MSPSTPRTSARRATKTRPHLGNKAVIVLCMFVTVMEGYNLIVFGSVVPLLLTDPTLAITEREIGLVGGIVYAGALIGVLGGTALADRFGRHRIMGIAAAVFAAGSALAAMAGTLVTLGGARLITGIGVGAAITTAMTLARNHAPQRRGSLVITITMAGVPLGGTLAAIFGIFIMPLLGWRSMFWIGSAMTCVILLAILMCRISEPEEVRSSLLSPAQKFAHLLRGRGWILVVVVALGAVTNMVTWLGLNVWLAESMRSLGFSLTQALTFAFVLTGAAVVGSFLTAAAADTYGSGKVSILCAALTLGGLVGIIFYPTSMGLALLFVSLIGIGGHSTQNLINATASGAVQGHSRGTILGLTNSMAFIGSFLGPVLGGGVFASAGAVGIFSLYSISAGLCLLLCFGLHYTQRKHPQTIASTERTVTPV